MVGIIGVVHVHLRRSLEARHRLRAASVQHCASAKGWHEPKMLERAAGRSWLSESCAGTPELQTAFPPMSSL